MTQQAVILKNDGITVGERFVVSFQRTLKVPDDGNIYPLPPGMGRFPLNKVADFREQVPENWNTENSFFIPMYQKEAMWMGFEGATWKPNAIKIGIGNINVTTGESFSNALNNDPQNYLVIPDQPWLDGIINADETIRQFVAMPLGEAYTVEAQITNKEEFGGIQIEVYEPSKNIFPEEKPVAKETIDPSLPMIGMEPPVFASISNQDEMGIAAGGQLDQKIYPDQHGLEVWDKNNFTSINIYIVNSEQYFNITGILPPSSPITAEIYAENNFPWFDLYDDDLESLTSTKKLEDIKSINEIDQEKGKLTGNEKSIEIDDKKILKVHKETSDKKIRKEKEF